MAHEVIGDSSTSSGVALNGQPALSLMWTAIIEKGIFRFDIDTAAKKTAWPSLSFQDKDVREVEIEVEREPILKPVFQVENAKLVAILRVPDGSSFYGTGEVSGPLERNGKQVTGWNTDAWGYNKETAALYQSHPWVLVVQPDGTALGILADTTRHCEVDLRVDGVIRFVGTAPYPIITFGPYETPANVLQALAKAIGVMPMPPLWAVGFQQCRWSYLSAARVVEVVDTFRAKKLPCDVIWMDIDYMDGFRCFTWDPKEFPDPKGLREELRSKGFRAVWMLDPGLKKEDAYEVYSSGCKEASWVLNKDGVPFVGEVWPGDCVFPDYTNGKTREWWAQLVANIVAPTADGIWNDMNEPSVFGSLTKTMPLDNVHLGDEDLGGRQTHAHYHNVYGMLMARATYEGMLRGKPDCRPFVLTRAGYIGSHRYAATWTGDNLATWEHLSYSIPMALNLGLSGQPISGPDIGGFAGNATPRLFARWMGTCSLFPFARAHSEKGTEDQEPWCFGTQCEDVCRRALERRYRLLPHLYTLIYHAHTTGVPVMTPTFFSDTADRRLRRECESFLLGPLLVVTSSDAHTSAWGRNWGVPAGIWHQFDFSDHHPDLPLLFLQGGSMIPMGCLHQSTDDVRPEDPIELLISLDKDGKAKGMVYEDTGDGHGYKDGKFLLTEYEAHSIPVIDPSFPGQLQVVVTVVRTHGHMQRPKRQLLARVLLGTCTEVSSIGIDGEAISVRMPSSQDVASQAAVQIERLKSAEDTEPLDNSSMEEWLMSADEDKNVVLKYAQGPWRLSILPSLGGRIESMLNHLSGREMLHSQMDAGGYEEYSSIAAKPTGAREPYRVLKTEGAAGSVMRVEMEGDIDGGLAIVRSISADAKESHVLSISSSIVAKAVGAGAGGFSRLACLRTRPTFDLRSPPAAVVRFTAMDGSSHDIVPDLGEVFLKGQHRPNGEWLLVDLEKGEVIVNRFDTNEVETCCIKWGAGTCTLELRSEERPVSETTSLSITQAFEMRRLERNT